MAYHLTKIKQFDVVSNEFRSGGRNFLGLFFRGEDGKTGFRASYFFIVQFEISSSGHMRANNQRLRVRGRFIYGGAREEKGWLVKYWLHRFRPLLPRVKHGDIWR